MQSYAAARTRRVAAQTCLEVGPSAPPGPRSGLEWHLHARGSSSGVAVSHFLDDLAVFPLRVGRICWSSQFMAPPGTLGGFRCRAVSCSARYPTEGRSWGSWCRSPRTRLGSAPGEGGLIHSFFLWRVVGVSELWRLAHELLLRLCQAGSLWRVGVVRSWRLRRLGRSGSARLWELSERFGESGRLLRSFCRGRRPRLTSIGRPAAGRARSPR